MAIYIPGWYEQMAKAGSIPRLANAISERVAPDFNANRRLQEMVQQNPMLLEQFSNMDEGTRAQLAKSLGFVNKDPIKNLPVGQQRKDREADAATIASLTPEQAAERAAAKVGAPSTYALRRRKTTDTQQDTTFELNKKATEQQFEINTFRVKDLKRTQADLDAAIAQFPDLAKVDYKSMVRDFVRQGKPLDSMLMLATDANPGAKMVLDFAMKVELQKLEAEQRASLAKAKDPNTKLMYLNTLKELGTQLNRSEQNLIDQQTALMKDLVGTFAYQMARTPEAKAALKAEIPGLADVERRLAQVQSDVRDNMQKATFFSNQVAEQEGVKLPPQGTADPEAAAALEAIRQRPDQAAKIRAMYKSRTGKELP